MPPSVFECRKFSVYLSACKIKLETFFLSSLTVTYFQFQFPLLVSFYFRLLIVFFRFVTCVKEELLDIQFMLMNYIIKLTRDNADSNVYHMKKRTDTQLNYY